MSVTSGTTSLASVFLLAMYQAGLAERPQHLILRVAVDIVHGSDVEGVLQTLASTIQPHAVYNHSDSFLSCAIFFRLWRPVVRWHKYTVYSCHMTPTV
ncbi:hypothetical protein BGW80DRAFT_1357895 [Lactifluus volemus]|nr:hypothetical protein BGW80DRAFT_1405596 [Lactifluus volemus]KAH9959512.1 hypothetical protein BGW80DRAFT_1367802 [Lactifluus volemus]KAH9961690.1 hypothetical protein BGW80DRAFT_1357895 [Lactifluus volemus]